MPADPPADFDLASLRGRRRAVLLFAPFVDHDRYVQQKQMLAAAQGGLEDRNVTLVAVVGDSLGLADDRPISPGSIRRLRERFDIGLDTYATIVVDHDGSERLRDHRPIHARRLFRAIDAVPASR